MHEPQSITRNSVANSSVASEVKPASSSLDSLRVAHMKREPIPEFSEIILASRHRPFFVTAAGTILSVLGVVIAWQSISATFEAESLVRVRQRQDVVYSPSTSRSDDAEFVRAQSQIVLAPQVLGSALESEDIIAQLDYLPVDEAVKSLEEMIRVDIQTGSEVMSIKAVHPSAEFSQALCNAVTLAYLEEIKKRTTTDQELRRSKLQAAATQADQRLDELWAELNKVASDLGSDNSESLTIRDEIQLQAYRDYSQQLRAAQMRANELQSLLAEAEMQVSPKIVNDDASIDLRLQNHPEVQAAQLTINQIDEQVQRVRAIAADPNSARLSSLLAEREARFRVFEELVATLRPQLLQASVELNEAKQADGLKQLQKKIELNNAERDFIRTRLAEIDTGAVRTGTKNGVQLEMARHAVERQTRLADSLWQSLEELKIESQSQPRVTLLHLSQIPQHSNHSRQVKMCVLAAAVSWLAAIVVFGYIECRSHVIRSTSDVAMRTNLPVFGLNLLSRQRNGLAPCAKELVTRLLLKRRERPATSTWMVTSASTMEPRHLVALDAAIAFAAFHQRTLLIDCDTASRDLGRLLHCESMPGTLQLATDSSANGKQAVDYIVASDHSGLDVLPLGQSSDTNAWIGPELLERIFDEVGSKYTEIVLNGPALLGAPESLLLADSVHGMVLSVFVDTSCWHQMVSTESLARESEINLVGVVLHSGGHPTIGLDLTDCQMSPAADDQDTASEELIRNELGALQQEMELAKQQSSKANSELKGNEEPA